jgi:hypothetical protein
VQDVARAHLTIEPYAGEARAAMLFAVGPAPMVQGARVLAKSLGIPESDVRTNY